MSSDNEQDQPSEQNAQGVGRCRHCGYPVAEDAPQCVHCGSLTPFPPETPPDEWAEARLLASILWKVLAVVVVVAFIATIFFPGCR
ncbi:MAG: hypothetical protein Q4D38_05860 [Planctomycetia bacterium]|nr:hypothetical protein [Planctomycetia bacterium]